MKPDLNASITEKDWALVSRLLNWKLVDWADLADPMTVWDLIRAIH